MEISSRTGRDARKDLEEIRIIYDWYQSRKTISLKKNKQLHGRKGIGIGNFGFALDTLPAANVKNKDNRRRSWIQMTSYEEYIEETERRYEEIYIIY